MAPTFRSVTITPIGPVIGVNNLAIDDLVLRPAEGVDAEGAAVDAQFRRLGHLELGNQIADGGIRSGEADAGCLTDQAASAVAPDEILRPQRPAIAELDIDAGIVLREACHLDTAIGRHLELLDPAGQYALDMDLPQPEPVIVPGGEIADVQPSSGEISGLRFLPLRQKSIGDAALIENLEGARMQTARARAGEVLARRSTMAASTPANASSPANIRPVGPPPTTTTA